jgi:hypothetical protein
MAFEKSIEAVIQEAISHGEFDNLPGAGKPVNLDAYFDTPESVRVAQALLKEAGILPLEVQLLQEIAELKERKAAALGTAEQDHIAAILNQKQVNLNLRLERLRHQVK